MLFHKEEIVEEEEVKKLMAAKEPDGSYKCPKCKKLKYIRCGNDGPKVNLYCMNCGNLYYEMDYRLAEPPTKSGQCHSATLKNIADAYEMLSDDKYTLMIRDIIDKYVDKSLYRVKCDVIRHYDILRIHVMRIYDNSIIDYDITHSILGSIRNEDSYLLLKQNILMCIDKLNDTLIKVEPIRAYE